MKLLTYDAIKQMEGTAFNINIKGVASLDEFSALQGMIPCEVAFHKMPGQSSDILERYAMVFAPSLSFEEFEEGVKAAAFAEAEDSNLDADVCWRQDKLRALYNRIRQVDPVIIAAAQAHLASAFWAGIEEERDRLELALKKVKPC